MTVFSLPDVANAPGLRLEVPSSSSLRTPALIAVGGGLLLFTFLLVGPVAAQVSQRGGEEATRTPQEQRFERGRSGLVQPSTNLPDWAEPSNSGEPSASKNDVETMAETPPPPPSPPPQVPVDGGLALLAAAGAGYAVRKLKGGDGDSMP